MKTILDFNSYFLNESFKMLKTSYDYEWVKTTTLYNYIEFDRSDRESNINILKNILASEGFTEPLILQYSHKFRRAYLKVIIEY
jgi:hypothetical protein